MRSQKTPYSHGNSYVLSYEVNKCLYLLLALDMVRTCYPQPGVQTIPVGNHGVGTELSILLSQFLFYYFRRVQPTMTGIEKSRNSALS